MIMQEGDRGIIFAFEDGFHRGMFNKVWGDDLFFEDRKGHAEEIIKEHFPTKEGLNFYCLPCVCKNGGAIATGHYFFALFHNTSKRVY